MKQLIFSSLADVDIRDAVDYYNFKQLGLGDRFFSELQSKIERVVLNPANYVVRYRNIRCAKIDRFPFMIHFIDEEFKFTIVGIIHTSRNPKLWKNR